MSNPFRRKLLMSIGALAMACAMPAYALTVGGTNFPDTATVDGKTLVLNGASMRQILIIKIYAAGLYLEKKAATAADVFAQTGPRRLQLVMQREVNSDEFGQLFITSMNKNSTKAEKSKVINQTSEFGEQFADKGVIYKGDVVWVDWIPGKGTLTSVNGKPIGSLLPDIAFNNAVLRIFLGDNPPQSNMKSALLGEK